MDVEFLNGANKNSTQNYNNGTIYAKLDFSVSSQTKDPKNNASKLTIVPSADTRDLIEVNLYDYGENINDLYKADHKYPGFQQNEGTFFYASDSTSSLGQYKFNLGDNITSDLNAGKTNVTNQGGLINSTNDAANGSINRPITGAMQSTLGTDGYPALNDGTSLGYLFSNNTYATKKNSQSINGLFQYNEITGAYTFNSRENHAQFNASNDTFTLYDQILSSNAMMYPFGNFLPFNDIVKQSAQSSIIDRDYLISIMNSARQKGEINLDGITNYETGPENADQRKVNRYTRLADQMQKFIDRMDAQTGNTNWTLEDLTRSYFNKSGIPSDIITNALLSKIYTIDFDEPTDFYFGMEMKMNFMQPKNGLTGKDGKQPMEFYFTGDDDVWVYIDGKLVLDLSGIHRHVGGKIDFVNGTVSYYELSKSTGDVGTIPYKTVSFASLGLETDSNGRLKDYSTHSFNFYYMERGSGSGVCRMNFNFPLLKKNSISVSKELSVDDKSLEEVLGNPNFKFQILKENGTDLFISSNTSYDIQDIDGNILGQGQTDNNGIFTLKAGQTAVFKDIDENSGKYFVRELLNPDEFSQYGTISVDGSSQTSNYDVTIGSDSFKGVNSPIKDMSDGSTYFYFNNSITFNKLGKLSITKELESNDVSNHKEFKFKVTLDGILIPAGTTYKVENETKTVTEEGMISLKPNETATISNVLAGSTYTVEEINAEGYEVSYKVGETTINTIPTGNIQTNETINIVVHNKEKSSSVNIPVYKKLSNPDGKEHEYQFDLVQVTDQIGNTEVSDGTKNSITIKIPASSSQEYSETFTINYTHSQIDTSPKDFFYKITETRLVNKEMATTFDSSIYVIKVTVTKDEKGNLDASITDVYKNGNSTNENISFLNTITEYELPETGGPGDWLYIGSGIGLITIAGYFLVTRRIHGKEDISS
ncbi:MAG: Spy0128 family protein [Floccifex sp.]